MRVVLGMSGGVDSSASAAYLLRAGYDVLGVTCIFTGACDDASARDAAAVCDELGIRHEVVDARSMFQKHVVEPFICEYAQGRTPSPCVGCNACCKIPVLLNVADELGYEKVATGHYARVVLLKNGRFAVKRGLDNRKDQSYMLSMLSQDQLARLVLPLGGATKPMVRIDAADMGLPVAEKPESQDICFIDGNYADFLVEHGLVREPGPIVDTTGAVIGRHTGLFDYTIGQRHGIGVSAEKPYYVIGKDASANTLFVGFASDAMIGRVEVDDMNWQAFATLEEPLNCSVRLRYRTGPVGCTVMPLGDSAGAAVSVSLLSPQPTTSPGQYAVFSLGDTVLGGGVIARVQRFEKEG